MMLSVPGIVLALVALLAGLFPLGPVPIAASGQPTGERLTEANAARLAPAASADAPGASLLAVSPLGKVIAAASPSGEIQLFAYQVTPQAQLELIKTVPAGEAIFSLSFSPDGLWLAAGAAGAVLVYRTIDWALYARLPADGDVLSLALVSRRLAAGTSTGYLLLWQKNYGPGFRLEHTLPLRRTERDQQVFSAPVDSLAASQAYYRIGHGLGDGLWVLDAVDGAAQIKVTFQADYWFDNFLTTLAFTPDGRYLLCRQYGGTFTLWHISGAMQRQVIVSTGGTASLAISPDSRLAAMGGDRLSLWEIPELAPVSFEHGGTAVARVAFSPDGKALVTLDASQTVRIWAIFANSDPG